MSAEICKPATISKGCCCSFSTTPEPHHSNATHLSLHWLPVWPRIVSETAILLRKCIHVVVCAYIYWPSVSRIAETVLDCHLLRLMYTAAKNTQFTHTSKVSEDLRSVWSQRGTTVFLLLYATGWKLIFSDKKTMLWRRHTWAKGLDSTKCRYSPHCETYWSRIRRWIVRNFQISIVSAVKICQKCLQTVSASPQTPTGASHLESWTRLSPKSVPRPRGYGPQTKFPGAVSGVARIWCGGTKRGIESTSPRRRIRREGEEWGGSIPITSWLEIFFVHDC